MSNSNRTFDVELPIRYRHQVHFTRGSFSPENPLFEKLICEMCHNDRPRVFVVVDASVDGQETSLGDQIRSYLSERESSIQLTGCLVLPGGEGLKNSPELLDQLYRCVDDHKLCRHSCIVAIGGGALLDLVGFVAATAHRGIRHLRMPTTSLSQGDGGCGVKNGVNFLGKKNFIGSFLPPDAVINDSAFLETLPFRQLRDGYIEAVKVALIRDRVLFDWIEQNAEGLVQRDPDIVQEVVEASAKHHINHIATSGDPFELTSSRPLDFGHWAAHKLEVISDFSLSHGEAVAIGISLDSLYSVRVGLLGEAQFERIIQLIERLGFPTFDELLSQSNQQGWSAILLGLEEFREHLGGKLTIPLLEDIGRQVEVNEMDSNLVLSCVEELGRRKS
ncbi:MAG: 3-dehydroquinate synthase [Verrucomicrobiota bacterium]